MHSLQASRIKFSVRRAARAPVSGDQYKQSLDYLYKEKYDLRTDQSNGIYTVRLRLRI